MQTVLTAFDIVGLAALAIVCLGFVATVVATVASAAAVLRPRAALWLGAAAVVLGTATAAIGATRAVLSQRANARLAAHSYYADQPIEHERMRRAGYRGAQSWARAGAACSVVALVAGTASLLASLLRVTRRVSGSGSDQAHASIAWLIAGAGLSTLGLMAGGLTFFQWQKPLPGRDLDPDDPLWAVLAASDAVMRGSHPTWMASGCRTIERLYEARARTPVPGPGQAPDLVAAANRCFDMARAEALTATLYLSPSFDTPPVDPAVPVAIPSSAGELQTRFRALRELADSPLLIDAARKERVDEDLTALQRAWPVPPAAASIHRPPVRISVGTPVVSGGVPIEVIERFLTSQLGPLASCYSSRALQWRLAGEVQVGFTISPLGFSYARLDAGSTFPDPDTVDCVVLVVDLLRFPPPRKREDATATVSFRLAPP